MFSAGTDNFGYNNPSGLMLVRLQVARFLTRHFVQGGGGGDGRRCSSVDGGEGDADGKLDGIPADQGTDGVSANADADADETKVVNLDNVLLSTGGASILNLLFFALGEKKDVVLIPAPYYAAFETDMKAFAGMVPCAIRMANPSRGPTVEELEVALTKVEQVCVVRALMSFYLSICTHDRIESNRIDG